MAGLPTVPPAGSAVSVVADLPTVPLTRPQVPLPKALPNFPMGSALGNGRSAAAAATYVDPAHEISLPKNQKGEEAKSKVTVRRAVKVG